MFQIQNNVNSISRRENLKKITVIHYDSGLKFDVNLKYDEYNRVVRGDKDYVDELAAKYFELYQEGLVTTAPSKPAETSASATSSTVSTDMLSPKSNIWNKNETIALLDIYKNKKEILDNPKLKKKDVYERIAQEMEQKYGFKFSSDQCMNRMKTLLKKYKEINDHNNTSGNNYRKWEYFEEMSKFLGDKPFVKPVAPCSSLSLSTVTTESDASYEDENALCNPTNPRKKRKVAASPRQEMVKWLQDYKEDVQARENIRLEVVERHHQENKKLIENLINVVKKDN